MNVLLTHSEWGKMKIIYYNNINSVPYTIQFIQGAQNVTESFISLYVEDE